MCDAAALTNAPALEREEGRLATQPADRAPSNSAQADSPITTYQCCELRFCSNAVVSGLTESSVGTLGEWDGVRRQEQRVPHSRGTRSGGARLSSSREQQQ